MIGNPHALLPHPLAHLTGGFVNNVASVIQLAVLDNFNVVVVVVLLLLNGRMCTLDEMLSSGRGISMRKYLPCVSKVQELAAASTRPSLVSSRWEHWPHRRRCGLHARILHIAGSPCLRRWLMERLHEHANAECTRQGFVR